LKPAQENNLWDPILKKTYHQKKDWWSGSRCKPWVQTPVLQKQNTKQTNKKNPLKSLQQKKHSKYLAYNRHSVFGGFSS
jgi:hypothetical protein